VSSQNLNSISEPPSGLDLDLSLASFRNFELRVVTRGEHTVQCKNRMASGQEDHPQICPILFAS
jgi:hypothetical protein